jgi:EAL domain-containing protein (putative c-di-GMP-specific phosphodiesterase class I)
VTVADVEFTFFSGRAPALRDTATQPIDGNAGDRPGAGRAIDVIRAVRRLHEILAHRAVIARFQPIVELGERGTLGYETSGEADHGAADFDEPVLALRRVECRLAGRFRQLQRMLSAEEALRLPGPSRLFFKLDASEIGVQGLIGSLTRIQEVLEARHVLVVGVPDSAACDTPYYHEFHRVARERGLELAHEGFAAGASQLARHRKTAPDFIKPAPSLVRGLRRSAQRRRQFQSLLRAARDIGSEIIAAGVDAREEAEICEELGCRYAQGAFCGRPQAVESLLRAARGPAAAKVPVAAP